MRKKESNGCYVITLSKKDKPALLEVFTQSFGSTPQMPILQEKNDKTRIIMKQLLTLYDGAGKSFCYGIKQKNVLICAAYCIESDASPKIHKLLAFGLVTFKSLVIRGIQQFMRCKNEKPSYNEQYLEVLLYGTLPAHQQQGLGKKMMDFLYNEAEQQGYHGLIGVTDCSKPAFRFYMKDGWVADHKFCIGKNQLCWVRRIV